MSTITYDSLIPILENEEIKGDKIYCTFKCEGLPDIVGASAMIVKDEDREDEEGLMAKVKHSVSSLMFSILGGGNGEGDSGGNYKFTQEEIQAAVVDSFLSVAPYFYWDTTKRQWCPVNKLSQFAKQLVEFPVEDAYDKDVLSRMLVELANIDGKMVQEELEFLASFTNSELSQVVDMLKQPPLSAEDLAKVGAKAKETMFMLAWTVVLIDEDLAEQEKEKLADFAEMLQIPEPHAFNLMKMAQSHIIESIATQGVFMKDDLRELAEKINFSYEEAQRVIAEYRDRQRG